MTYGIRMYTHAYNLCIYYKNILNKEVVPISRVCEISLYIFWDFISNIFNIGKDQSLGEANKNSSLEWQRLTEEERMEYKDKAGHAAFDENAKINPSKYRAKILNHLHDLVHKKIKSKQWLWFMLYY